MADEPRRSGRSTKGQHKNLDMVTEAPVKRAKSKSFSKEKSAKPSAEPTPGPSEEGREEEVVGGEEEEEEEEEEEGGSEELIRCICGQYEEEEDVERDMICCDKCSAWQHNDCMGLSFPKGEEPDQYYCEKCKPENHKELLDSIANGAKPWEEVAERRRKEAEEKKSTRRKRGRKGGRRGRPSESKTETSTPARSVKAQTPSSAPSLPPAGADGTPGQEEKEHGDDAVSSGTPKRKFDEHQGSPQSESGPKQKQQKMSPLQTKASSNGPTSRHSSLTETTPIDLPSLPDEISNPARKSAASALVKLFVDQIAGARKEGSFKLPQGKTADEVSRQLGLSIEHAMYVNICGGSVEPTEPYKLQLRTILFNVKKNTALRDRLLVGNLLPDDLSRMSSQDMASKELQQKDAEIKREAERQHTIIQEQGPRIKRTHKGEEVIEDDIHNVASEPVFSTAPARRAVAEGSSSPQQERPRDGRRSDRLQSLDTKSAAAQGIDKHEDTGSPGGAGQDQVFPEVATHIREPLPGGKLQADAEIDHLLRDEEPDSPPYSPKDYSDEGVVWHGRIVMSPIGEFTSSAKHVGGADLSEKVSWHDLAPSTLLINGRIEIQLASNYLCGLRFSSSTDVSVISVGPPENPKERAGFDNLFNYFADRKRYGVIGKHPLPLVTDTYLVPVEAGTNKRPDFLELLDNNSIDESLTERMFLIVFVVKTGSSNPPSVHPQSHHPSQEPLNPANSFATSGQQSHYPMPGQQAAPQASPMTPAPFHGAPFSQAAPYGQVHQPQVPGQYQQYQSSVPAPQASQNGMPLTGLAAAIQILGPQAHAPAIQQLLHQAPNADASQLLVVRDILVRQPDAASSYQALTEALFHATTNGHGRP